MAAIDCHVQDSHISIQPTAAFFAGYSSMFMKTNNVEILNAVFTPMLPDGAVNYSRIPDIFAHCIHTGAQGIFLNGTTGECMSLSTQERMQLVEAWTSHRKEINRQDFKIFVHVGSCNLYETVAMAKHAQTQGVDGIAMVATFYFRPKTVDELIEQCEYVAAAVPDTPFYYYSIPALTGINFPLIGFLERASRRIPNFAGLKSSSTDIVDYQHCIHFAEQNYTLYWGTDEAFTMLYAAGNRHYVGSTYNYMSSFYHKMAAMHDSGDTTTLLALMKEADAIYRIILENNSIIAGKEIMCFLGVDCGPVRRPLRQLTTAESNMLHQKLEKTTLFRQTLKSILND